MGEFAQEHFVKTAHLQSLLDKLDKAVENKESCSYFMHGISGVGKTYALDALHCYALEKGLFVIHMKSGSYKNIWDYDMAQHSWEFMFLRQLFSNGKFEPLLREHFGLPPNSRPKEERNARENKCEDLLDEIHKVLNIESKISANNRKLQAADCLTDFWDQVLTDDDDIEDGREKKMVCLIFDDINVLSKGYTQLPNDEEVNLTKPELAHHKELGRIFWDCWKWTKVKAPIKSPKLITQSCSVQLHSTSKALRLSVIKKDSEELSHQHQFLSCMGFQHISGQL